MNLETAATLLNVLPKGNLVGGLPSDYAFSAFIAFRRVVGSSPAHYVIDFYRPFQGSGAVRGGDLDIGLTHLGSTITETIDGVPVTHAPIRVECVGQISRARVQRGIKVGVLRLDHLASEQSTARGMGGAWYYVAHAIGRAHDAAALQGLPIAA